MTETIVCPTHGDKPAVPSLDAPEFTSCRGCWYLEWLAACLLYRKRR